MTAQRRSFQPLLGALVLILAAVFYLALYARAATLDVAYADYLLPPFITAVWLSRLAQRQQAGRASQQD